MNKIKILSLLLSIGLLSCNTPKRNVGELELAKKYYGFLDNSDSSGMLTILGDSIVIREAQDDYEERFSNNGYIEWLKWESVFDPTYKVLEIEQENEVVKAKISKVDRRILFLHEEPMVWHEIIRFDDDKIVRVERIEYEVFDLPKFLKNRDQLSSWIKENHPDLNGFLYDQTKSGGMKYVKAIELYSNKN